MSRCRRLVEATDFGLEHCMNEVSNDGAPASVAENIDKIIRVENNVLERRSGREAVTDAIGGFVGTVAFVVWQLVSFLGWIVVYAEKVPGIRPFDPFPYPLLSSITSLEAVLLAAFVLMKQNRMSVIADRRDHLDLQVNLLTERKATQIIQMLDRLSLHLGGRTAPRRRQPRAGATCWGRASG
jgi:uncharacterized membrane protein